MVVLFLSGMALAACLLGTGFGALWHEATRSREPTWGEQNYGTNDPTTIYRMQFQRSMDATIFQYEMVLISAKDESQKEFIQGMINSLVESRDKEIEKWKETSDA